MTKLKNISIELRKRLWDEWQKNKLNCCDSKGWTTQYAYKVMEKFGAKIDEQNVMTWSYGIDDDKFKGYHVMAKIYTDYKAKREGEGTDSFIDYYYGVETDFGKLLKNLNNLIPLSNNLWIIYGMENVGESDEEEMHTEIVKGHRLNEDGNVVK